MDDLVQLTRDHEIAVITINNPPVNALSPAVAKGIAQAIEQGQGPERKSGCADWWCERSACGDSSQVLPCDTKLVSAWISGRYAYTGETWQQFRERVASCRLEVGNSKRRENIVVFTSATPIAIWTGMSLDICDGRLMQLAGALYNASYTVMRLRDAQLRLFTFNAAPHLSGTGFRTHR